MGPIEVLAVDVDGTLLDPSHRVAPVVADGVQRLRDRGIHVILTTARYPAAIRQLQSRLGLTGEWFVACQGAIVGRFVGRGTDLRLHQRMPLSAARELTRMARSAGLWTSWYDAGAWRAESDDPLVAAEAAIVGTQPLRMVDLGAIRAAPAKVTVMARAGDEGRLQPLLAVLPAGLAGAISRPDYAEVVANGVSKAGGLRVVLASLGLNTTSMAAAGDGSNDLEMLRLARLGIAMAHAPEALRWVATWVVPSNSEDGLATAIDRLFAEGLVP